MKPSGWKPVLFALIGIITCSALCQEPKAPSDQELWHLATKAYQNQQIETGHIHLDRLIQNNPGDIDLALKCLQKMQSEDKARNDLRLRANQHLKFIESSWGEQAARRLCSLERIGAISANSKTIQDAFQILLDHHAHRGRLLEAMDLINHFVKKNPNEPFFRIAEARFHRQLHSAKTQALYDRLKTEMDLDHPDPVIRARWAELSEAMTTNQEELPRAIQPLPKGSPLLLMNLQDAEGEWLAVSRRSPRVVSAVIDRLAAKSLLPDQVVIWQDKTGVMDASYALDLHLLRQPAEELEPLRKLQSERYLQVSKTEELKPLALFRRFPWAPGAQKQLLEWANRQLWAGQIHSALRSFGDLLDHASEPELRKTARLGYWTALAQVKPPVSQQEMLNGISPDNIFQWQGKPTKAAEICKQLIASRPKPKKQVVPALKNLVQHVVHAPPISPWSGAIPGAIDLTVEGDELLLSSRNVLAAYNARKPEKRIWSHFQGLPVEDQGRRNDYPGYFRPQVDGQVLYTRWGFSSVPNGIAAIDRSTGQPLWSTADQQQDHRRTFQIPLGDPVLHQGLLYYLQWNARENINHARERRISLVCYDPQQKNAIWEGTVVAAESPADLQSRLAKARPDFAIYGNRVTVHRGAIYSSTNSGVIARSDIRDGRTEWLHYYRTTHSPGSQSPGSSPVIAGKLVICMPRDADRIFALDRQTGRLVWENPFVQGVQTVGSWKGLIILRDRSNLIGLDQTTGVIQWYRPIQGPVRGRAQMAHSSIFIAQPGELLRLNASTGHVEESRAWGLRDERPGSFLVHGQSLYVVTDKPDDKTNQPWTPTVAEPSTAPGPLQTAWTLPRPDATLTIAPESSELRGMAYVCSGGILECIDVSAKGAVRWQRFVDAHNPRIHFAGKTLLVIENAPSQPPKAKNHIVAFDALSGRALWETGVGLNIRDMTASGTTQLLHNGEGRIVALDLDTGRQTWERDFGLTRQLQISWKQNQLHVCFISRTFTPQHRILNPANGITLHSHTIDPPLAVDGQNNARPIRDGYYEVKVKPVRARYVRLVTLSDVNGAGWASMAELQVIGADGENISRERWKVHKASSWETRHKYGRPELVFDGDRRSWWHTPWIRPDGHPIYGGTVKHPHELQIDLGTEQIITGIRYLPAAIVNNNGTIRDYELYASKDGKNPGDRIARGILVQRMRVDHVGLADNGLYFQTSANQWVKQPQIYRYAMDSKPSTRFCKNARLVYLKDPYLVVVSRKNNEDVLVVRRLDDHGYAFDLGPTKKIDSSQIEIANDRLVMARRGVLIADLTKKKFLLEPGDEKQKHNQNGLLIREGQDHLLKIVSGGPEGEHLFRFNLKTGQRTETILSSKLAALKNPRAPDAQKAIQYCQGIVLVNDSSAITAWRPKPDSKE